MPHGARARVLGGLSNAGPRRQPSATVTSGEFFGFGAEKNAEPSVAPNTNGSNDQNQLLSNFLATMQREQMLRWRDQDERRASNQHLQNISNRLLDALERNNQNS